MKFKSFLNEEEMAVASSDDFEDIKQVLSRYPIFDNLDWDRMKERIEKGMVLFTHRTVVVLQKYDKPTKKGNIQAGAGDAIIHQTATETPGIGNATRAYRELIDNAKRDGVKNIWASVRKTNNRAIHFYEKMGFRYFGKTSFRGGTVPASIYKLEIQ